MYVPYSTVSPQPIMCSRTLWISGSHLLSKPLSFQSNHAWLQYDSKFCTLAAADPLLRWDQRCWSCPYCRATNNFCSHAPFHYKKYKIHQSTEYQITEYQIIAEHISVKFVGCLIKDTVPIKTTLTKTFAFLLKVNTLEPSAQEGREPLLVNANRLPYDHSYLSANLVYNNGCPLA